MMIPVFTGRALDELGSVIKDKEKMPPKGTRRLEIVIFCVDILEQKGGGLHWNIRRRGDLKGQEDDMIGKNSEATKIVAGTKT
jgi:hypothetical protein